MDDTEVLAETWTVLKEYIKDKQHAADHWIGNLIDTGIDEESILDLTAVDKYLANAAEHNGIETDDDEDDEDEYE
tara:strand:+ start:268 stop:492 length:225 start_codon:yes stop_codon:yes gene_type:complete